MLQPPMSIPHPTAALTAAMHASLPHFLPSPALASPVGSSPSSQPGMPQPTPCSTLFVANLGQFVSEHELKEIFARFVQCIIIFLWRRFLVEPFLVSVYFSVSALTQMHYPLLKYPYTQIGSLVYSINFLWNRLTKVQFKVEFLDLY